MAALAGLLLGALLAAGCATTEGDGDMPWSTPEPWEGTVPLPPGMFQE